MYTSGVNSINFSAKKPQIRFADDLARKVSELFPACSLSRTNYWRNRAKVQKFFKGESKSFKIYQEAITTYSEIIYSNKKNYTKFNLLMDAIEKYKLANCFERSLLALVMAKCAGLKNCSIKSLRGEYNSWLDHAILYVADKKNPYIIDPWLGFADYLPKAFERYNCEYRQFMPFVSGKYHRDMHLVDATNSEFPFPSFLSDKALTPLSILKFANKRPELFIKYKKM